MDPSPYEGVLSIFTHFFAIEPKTLRLRNYIYHFAFDFVESEWKWDPHLQKNVKVSGQCWGGRLKDNSQFRFPISLLDRFVQGMEKQGVIKETLEIKQGELYTPAPAQFKLKDHYVPRDYQEEGIAFAFEQRSKGFYSSLLQMPTGSGKTVTLLAFASRLGQRMGMVISPAHFDSWSSYGNQYLGIPEERVYAVRGGKAIRKLFALAENNEFNYDFVLFSLRTLTEFFKAYEEDPQNCIDIYGGTPFEIWPMTQIGFLGGDEVHESFFSVYWMQTFIHGPFHLGLSATMLHKDAFIERMQNIIYPMSLRFDKIKMKKYIKYVNVGYRFENMAQDRIRDTFPRRTTYAQAAFEGTILKNRKVKKNIFKMLESLIETYYIRHRQPGDKLAVYMSRIEMVRDFCSHLQKVYPSLDIRTYVETDPYENVIEPDIRVTTRGSAGTGVDIGGLTTVVSFDNVDSAQASLQLLGRLREIPGKDVLFIQAYATNLPKHVTYKKSRDKLFADRLASVSETFYQGAM